MSEQPLRDSQEALDDAKQAAGGVLHDAPAEDEFGTPMGTQQGDPPSGGPASEPVLDDSPEVTGEDEPAS